MKIAVPVLLLVILAAGPAFGRGRHYSLKAGLEVTNNCDEAVHITVEGYGTWSNVEPGDTVFVGIEKESFRRTKTIFRTVSVNLASDNSVSDSDSCQIDHNQTTQATITCSHTGSAVTLSIDCLPPGETTAAVSRESAVVVASGSGLGFLWLLGAAFCRNPRRRAHQQVPAAPNRLN